MLECEVIESKYKIKLTVKQWNKLLEVQYNNSLISLDYHVDRFYGRRVITGLTFKESYGKYIFFTLQDKDLLEIDRILEIIELYLY